MTDLGTVLAKGEVLIGDEVGLLGGSVVEVPDAVEVLDAVVV